MDTVRHRMIPAAGGTLVAEDDLYRATFDAKGFAVEPNGASAFRVSTATVGRAGAMLDIHAGPWRGTGNVARRSLAPGVVEQVTATAGQVEWDVVLGARPAGRGDLRVDARVTGANGSPKQLASGWRWAVSGGRGLVMGALVVKDRSGAEVARARPRADASGVHLSVPAAVLDRGDYPLTLDPVVSVEHPVADAVPARAEGAQTEPAVASDGTDYLVVWSDYRPNGVSGHIVGARVTASGTVLDGTGIVISTGAGTQRTPAVAFDGTNYLVVWSDFTVGATHLRGAGEPGRRGARCFGHPDLHRRGLPERSSRGVRRHELPGRVVRPRGASTAPGSARPAACWTASPPALPSRRRPAISGFPT